ncbi:hypothetical protein T440DRAFT_282278 [Plenodomus tracheiphilus IPT5]|uniref:Uncharacterized protein n=1 Tax=Plenodomus tracheiphilus IPT5 TaxID=1408161 RepID=A0A6A7API2_9PLEO|nr:hypothetical protein T440DRAFT_282278 [Plenodomus tracheiphilus IPT5]
MELIDPRSHGDGDALRRSPSRASPCPPLWPCHAMPRIRTAPPPALPHTPARPPHHPRAHRPDDTPGRHARAALSLHNPPEREQPAHMGTAPRRHIQP